MDNLSPLVLMGLRVRVLGSLVLTSREARELFSHIIHIMASAGGGEAPGNGEQSALHKLYSFGIRPATGKGAEQHQLQVVV